MVAQVLAAPMAAAIQILDSRNRTGTPSPPSSGRTPRKARPDALSSERESLGSASSASTSATATPSVSPQPPKRVDKSPLPSTDIEPSTLAEIDTTKLISPAASVETVDESQVDKPPSDFEAPMLAETATVQLTSASFPIGETSDERLEAKLPRTESDALPEIRERPDMLSPSKSVNETFKPSGTVSPTLVISDSIVAVTATHEVSPQSYEALVQKTAEILPQSQVVSESVLTESKVSKNGMCTDDTTQNGSPFDDSGVVWTETRTTANDSGESIKSSSEAQQPEVSTIESRGVGIPQSHDVQLQDSKETHGVPGVMNIEQPTGPLNLTDGSGESFDVQMDRRTMLLDMSQASDDLHSTGQDVSRDFLQLAERPTAAPDAAAGYPPKPDSRKEMTQDNGVEPVPLIIFSPGTPAAKFETDFVAKSGQDIGSVGIANKLKERMASELPSQQPISSQNDQLISDDRLDLSAAEPSDLAPISGQNHEGPGQTTCSLPADGVADAVAKEALAPHLGEEPAIGQSKVVAEKRLPEAAVDETIAANPSVEATITQELEAATAPPAEATILPENSVEANITSKMVTENSPIEPTLSPELSFDGARSTSIPSAETSEVKFESKLYSSQMPQDSMLTVESPKKDQAVEFQELQSDRYLFEKAEIQPQPSAVVLSSVLRPETPVKLNGSTDVDNQRSLNATNDAAPGPTIPAMAAPEPSTDTATTAAPPTAGQSQSLEAGGICAEAIAEIAASKLPLEATITPTPPTIVAASKQPISEIESEQSKAKHALTGESEVAAPVSEALAAQPMPAAVSIPSPSTDLSMGYESLQKQNGAPASLAEASTRTTTPEECYMATTGKELAGEISIIRGFGVSKEPVLTPPDDSLQANDPAKPSQQNSLMGGLILSPAALLNYGIRKEAQQPSPPMHSEANLRKTSKEATCDRPQHSPKQSPSKGTEPKSAEAIGPQHVAAQSAMNVPQSEAQCRHPETISAANVPEAGRPKEPRVEDVSAKTTAGVSEAKEGPLSNAAAFPSAMASLALKMRPGDSASLSESASQVSTSEPTQPGDSMPSHNQEVDLTAAGDTNAITTTTHERQQRQQQRDFSSDSLDADSQGHLTRRSPDVLRQPEELPAISSGSAVETAKVNAAQPLPIRTESTPPSQTAPISDAPSTQVSSLTFQPQGRDANDDAIPTATPQPLTHEDAKGDLAISVHQPPSGTEQLPEVPPQNTNEQQTRSELFVETAEAPDLAEIALRGAAHGDELVVDTMLRHEGELPTAPLSSPLSLDSIAGLEAEKTKLSEAGRTTPDSLIGSFDEMRASGLSGDSIDDASPPRASSDPDRTKQIESLARPASGPGQSAGSEGIPDSLQTSLDRSAAGSSKSHRIRRFGDIRPPSPAHSLPGDDAAGRSPGLIRRCMSAKARSHGQLGDDGLSAADKATQMVIRLEKYRSINARLKLQKSASADVPTVDDSHIMAEAAEGAQEQKKWAPPTSISTGAASQNGGCCGGGGFPPILIQGGMIVDCGMLQVADVYIDSGIIRHVGPVDVNALPSSVTIIDAVGKYIFPGGIDISIASADLQDNRSFNAGHFAKFTKQAVIEGSTFFVSLVSQLHDESLLEAFTRCQQLAEQHAYCNFAFMVLVKTWTASIRSEMSLLVKNYGVNAFVFATSNAPGFARMLPDNELLEALRHCNDLGATAIGNLDFASDYAQLTTALNRFLTFAELSATPVLIVPINDPRLMNSVRKFRQKGVKILASCNTSDLAGSKLLPVQKIPYQNGHVQTANKTEYSAKKLNGTISSPTHQEAGIIAAGSLAFDRFGAAPSLVSLMSCGAIDVMTGGGQIDSAEVLSICGGRLNLLWHEGFKSGQLDAMRIAAATSSELAKLFNLYPQKGSLAEGADADLVIWDPSVPVSMATPLSPAANSKKMLSYLQAADQAPASPYCATILGGRVVAQNSKTMVKKKTGEFTPLKAGSPHVFRYSVPTEPGLQKAAQRDAILHQFDAFLMQKRDNVDRCHCHPVKQQQATTALVKKSSLGTADEQPRKSEVDYDALRKNAGLF